MDLHQIPSLFLSAVLFLGFVPPAAPVPAFGMIAADRRRGFRSEALASTDFGNDWLEEEQGIGISPSVLQTIDGIGGSQSLAGLDEFTGCGDVTEIPQSECEALVDFYESTNGPNWYYGALSGHKWLTINMPCRWNGITCNAGHVIAIEGVQWLQGNLPASIDHLINLQILDLGGTNSLTGIPPELGNLSSLQELELAGDLTTIPPELGNLSNLKLLDLSGNNLSNLPPELGNLSSLLTLDLGHNDLTSIPAELGRLSSLQTLDLSWNFSLNSITPELGRLSSLQTLDLAVNNLTSLPKELGNLVNLQTLDLDHNNLTSLPAELGNLVNLVQSGVNKAMIRRQEVCPGRSICRVWPENNCNSQ